MVVNKRAVALPIRLQGTHLPWLQRRSGQLLEDCLELEHLSSQCVVNAVPSVRLGGIFPCVKLVGLMPILGKAGEAGEAGEAKCVRYGAQGRLRGLY